MGPRGGIIRVPVGAAKGAKAGGEGLILMPSAIATEGTRHSHLGGDHRTIEWATVRPTIQCLPPD